MADDHYTVVDEVEDYKFPDPKPTKQYRAPIGPSMPGESVSASHHEKPSIFQRIAQVAAPGMVGEAKALGKKGAASAFGGFVGGAIHNTGKRVGSIMGKSPAPPVWLQDKMPSKKGKGVRKLTQIDGGSLPGWVFGGGMPWDRPRQQESDVERIVVTRIHADGRRTTSTRRPPGAKKKSRDYPEWFGF